MRGRPTWRTGARKKKCTITPGPWRQSQVQGRERSAHRTARRADRATTKREGTATAKTRTVCEAQSGQTAVSSHQVEQPSGDQQEPDPESHVRPVPGDRDERACEHPERRPKSQQKRSPSSLLQPVSTFGAGWKWEIVLLCFRVHTWDSSHLAVGIVERGRRPRRFAIGADLGKVRCWGRELNCVGHPGSPSARDGSPSFRRAFVHTTKFYARASSAESLERGLR